MNLKRLGRTDLELTTVGLGTWAMGGGNWAFAWGHQDDADSVRTIHEALDLGVNWIDTAPAYGLGHCEDVVGRALRGLSRKPMVATKCGRSWDADGKLYADLRKKVILAEVDSSLKRLGVEVIDLYQIHWPQPDEAIEEGWDAVAECVRAGKIRYAGVCNFSVAQLGRIQPIHPVASLQPPYSMLVRDVENGLLDYCASEGIGVVAYSPMQKGILTGKFSREWVQTLANDDHRRNDPQFLDPLLQANIELVQGLQKIAATHGRTVGELAVAWVLRRSEVTSAIVGARKPGQLRETAAAIRVLAPEEAVEIEELLGRRARAVAASAARMR